MSEPLDLAVKIFLLIFDGVVQFYYWVAILHILLSWLISFNIIDVHHRIMGRLVDVINRIVMPVYDWIYSFLKPMGGGIIAMFDFRPMLFLLFLYFFQPMVHVIVYKIIYFVTTIH